MRKLKVITLLLILAVIGLSCTTPPKQFAFFGEDRMDTVYKKNNIHGFVKHHFIHGIRYSSDSSLLNENGEITNILGFWQDDTLVYDSLNRLIYLSKNSDIKNRYKVTYELLPEEALVIERWTYLDGDGDTAFNSVRGTYYNESLDKILRQEVLSKKSEEPIGSTRKYLYEGDRLVAIVDDRFKTIFDYENKKLVRRRRLYLGNDKKFVCHEIDFFSKQTSLIDSMADLMDSKRKVFEDTDLSQVKFEKREMYYYKYF